MAVLRTVSKRSQLDSYGSYVKRTTTTDYFDSNYSTEGILTGGTSIGDINYQFEISWPAATGDVTWIHFVGRDLNFGFSDSRADGWLLELYDASDNEIGRLELQDGSVTPQVIADTTVTGATFTPLVDTTLTYFDIKVTVTASDITIELYINNVLVETATAANTVSGYGKPVKMLVDGNDSSYITDQNVYSEFIIADEQTIDWHLADLSHTSVGNYTDWSNSSTTANISDDNTATSYEINADNQKFSTVYGPYNGDTEGSGFEVKSVHYHFLGASTDSNNVTVFTRVSATDYEDETLNLAPLGTPTSAEVIIEQNPATTSAWTTTELGTIEVGLKSST